MGAERDAGRLAVADARATVLAFQRDTVTACADRVEEHPLGYVVVTPSLEAVWSLNALVVERPPADLALTALEAAFEEHLGEGRYASAVLHDDAIAERLAGEAADRGWKVEREVVMELRREPDRVADTSAVREATKEEVMPLMSSWFAEEHAEHGEETLRQLDAYAEREWRSRPPRAFVIGDGQATCKLWSDGTTAQVEDVYTAPAARGRGHARALVTHAVAAARDAGHELTFIVADDDGTPKRLYARLGFDPILRATRIVRERR